MPPLRQSFARHRPAHNANEDWALTGPPIGINEGAHSIVLSYELETEHGNTAVEIHIERNDWRKVLTTMVEADQLATLNAVSSNLNHLLEGLSEDEIGAVREIFDRLF